MSFFRGKRSVDLEGALALVRVAEQSLSASVKTERFYGEIEGTLKRLGQDTERLRNAEPKEGISDALRIRGVPNRDVMVSNLNAVQKISVPREKDYRAVMSFYREASSALEVPFGKLSYNIRFVRAVFPEEFSAVVSDVKRLRSMLERMAAPLLKKEDTIRAIDESLEILDELGSLGVMESKGVGSGAGDVERRLEEEKKRIEDVRGSEQWRTYEDLSRRLSVKREELRIAESEAEGAISSIRKVLSLLKKEDETGKRALLPEERRAVESLLSSPLETILDGESRECLLLVKKALDEDTVINREKRENGLRDIERISREDLSSKADEIKRVREEIDALEIALSRAGIGEEVRKSERRVEDLERELERAHEADSRSERHKTSIDKELSENLSELSTLLGRITGRSVEVTK